MTRKFVKLDELVAERVTENLDEYHFVPAYHVRIDDAWSLVDALEKRGVWVHELSNELKGNWRCIFADGKGYGVVWHQGIAPTVTLAICIAALRAVGVSQDEIDAAMT